MDEPDYIDALGAVLRLGKKFDVARVRQDAMKILKREFPRSLDEFIATIEVRKKIWKKTVDIFRLTTLAYEHDIQTILPLLYLICSSVNYVRKCFLCSST